jgi:predicted nucleic acid-binding protein
VITAVDTNVLLDVLGGDPDFGTRSAAAIRRCIDEGSVIACDVVWAETGASFSEPSTAEETLKRLRIDFSAIDQPSSLATSQAWRAYRRAGERGRESSRTS